ncbi:hypothetical protein ACXHH8_004064 [Enterobacter roggenkampii]|uniref:hypothetical protein n=1 Tax=Enterobacter roggenkampii TaxID=1812935 RepID=UPI0015E7E54A|nr:hypothetical protein [Enterobacter roggenkampii]MBA2155033.1 hypothetical protein [Enterobacter roggenkampii]
MMHTIDDSNFHKVVQAIKAGPTDIAFQSALELGFKWLEEYEAKLLKLTDEQARTLKDLLSQ